MIAVRSGDDGEMLKYSDNTFHGETHSRFQSQPIHGSASDRPKHNHSDFIYIQLNSGGSLDNIILTYKELKLFLSYLFPENNP